ncbi:MAG: imidazole glycerol phosphate synthase subunit HisH [Gammaproteobacteria bacterium]|nr:imidazole glycerol phosphate synthase subunit HisH [Gammaproteobacteria bacterium]
MQRVAVIDYGMGNLRSVAKALEHVAGGDAEVLVTDDPDAIASADRVVFPGQGAIRDCMRELGARGLEVCVRKLIGERPFLGICLGQQALMESSEEHAGTRGFGIVAGTVRRFPANGRDPRTGAALKVPHMGWNNVDISRDHPLWRGIESGAYFYFVHSYYVAPAEDALAAGHTEYGVRFASAIAGRNLFAVQFHPEKSARAGLKLLENFVGWKGDA